MKIPIEEHLNTNIRVRYLADAAEGIPALVVDGRDATYIITVPGLEDTSWTNLLAKFNAMNLANGALSGGCAECHDLCVAVYANMRSAYRKDPTLTQAMRSLPRKDRSAARTLARMKGINELWPSLPDVPGTTEPLVVGGITAEMFDDKTTAYEAKVKAASTAERQYTTELAKFHLELKEWDEFVSAALLQNRPLYKPGTPERALLDRIPTEPATQPPEQAQITLAESPADGVAHLTFIAEHATTFKVLHRGPADAEFAEVADVLLPGSYTVAGLPGGEHRYKIVGVNSRGEGPASAVVVLDVVGVGAPGVPAVSPPESLAPGEVHVQFTAAGATSFQVYHQGPGETGFTLVSTVPATAEAGEYSANGQAEGSHAYKVRGVNALGPGPFSTAVSLDVIAAAA